MIPRRHFKFMQGILLGGLFVLFNPARAASDELVMKVLVVNPSETEVREFTIHNPLPAEITPEHVVDADGLSVEYDAEAGAYMLTGSVTLKPKETMTKRILLEDVWIIPQERLKKLRAEVAQIQLRLRGTSYEGQGRILGRSIMSRLSDIQTSQEETFLGPAQHITRYRRDIKALQVAESELVSLRQLMVMAAVGSVTEPMLGAGVGDESAGGSGERGGLSVLATWKIIFVILGLLGLVSLWFFVVWQRQLKIQLAKQAERESSDPASIIPTGNDEGTAA